MPGEQIGSDALWTMEQAAIATEGKAFGNWKASGVSIDTRTLCPGDLFVALPGSRVDGHEFVIQALNDGAAAACVSQLRAEWPRQRLLVVSNTTQGLNNLGIWSRQRSSAKIAAITGSVGKTTTKEILLHCLSRQGVTSGSTGNHNNQLGVSLSLARLPAAARFGVFELGMSARGELAPLAHQVAPSVGIITTIAAAHLESFRNLEEIASAKSELFQDMDSAGIAILNRDNAMFGRLVATAGRCGLSDIRSFSGTATDLAAGAAAKSSARVISCELKAASSLVTALIRGGEVRYRLPMPGWHHVMNSLAVLLAVEALGADLKAAADALDGLSAIEGRGARLRVALEDGGECYLIDDSYNASPSAMEAAFAVMNIQEPQFDGRRMLVLGDMLELGLQSADLHLQLIKPLLASRVDRVFCCGEMMRLLYERLPSAIRGGYARDSVELAPMVKQDLQNGDMILVKGSAQSAMGVVIAALRGLSDCVL